MSADESGENKSVKNRSISYSAIGQIATIVITVCSWFGTFTVMSYRVDAADMKNKEQESELKDLREKVLSQNGKNEVITFQLFSIKSTLDEIKVEQTAMRKEIATTAKHP